MPLPKKKTVDKVQLLLLALLEEQDLSQQMMPWELLKELQSLSKFGLVNLHTFPVPLKMLKQCTGLTADAMELGEGNVNLDDFKFATLWVMASCSVLGIASLAMLLSIIGAMICYLLALIPVLFLGIGLMAPGIVARAIASLKNKGSDSNAGSVTMQECICHHKAVHFCCGYWCGLPICNYSSKGGIT